MKVQNHSLFVALLLLTISCKQGGKECPTSNDQLLELKPVNCRLMLPEYTIEDSMRYGHESLLNYRIKLLDSSIRMNCFISNYLHHSDSDIELNRIKSNQQNEVIFNRNDTELLTDKVQIVNSTRVGYLKYLVNMQGDMFYEGRIFFLRDNKLVTIWMFEKYESPQLNYNSMIDCIFKSMYIL